MSCVFSKCDLVDSGQVAVIRKKKTNSSLYVDILTTKMNNVKNNDVTYILNIDNISRHIYQSIYI
jgi:hypothetical protein